MTNDARRDTSKRGEQPKKRRGWDRRADRGRRMVRDRRREKVEVAFERRLAPRRRSNATSTFEVGRTHVATPVMQGALLAASPRKQKDEPRTKMQGDAILDI